MLPRSGNNVLMIDTDGEPLGSSANPFVVSGAPAGDATIVDGGDVCEGATDDTAATAGGTGTVSAKLRRATTQLVALGAVADAAVTDPTASASTIALLKGILTELVAINVILTDVHDAGTHTIKTSTP